MLLALTPAAQALTLGEISVRSTLGQRLDATVPVTLGAGEVLDSACVTAGQQTSDLRRVPDAQVVTPQAGREGAYELRVTSAAALYEPMYELELQVQCPGAPIMVRQYVLMLDLPGAVSASAPATAVPAAPTARRAGTVVATNAAVPTTETVQTRPATSRPAGKIATGSRYRVVAGDTLSTIAARVQDRGMTLKALATAIQSANPDAFIRNDANLIKLGSEILIPGAPVAASLAESSPAADAAAPAALAAVGSTAPPVAAVPTPSVATDIEPAALAQPPAVEAVSPAATAQPTPAPVAETKVPAAVRSQPRKAATKPEDESLPVQADEPNPFVAAGAGIVFGLLVSTFLWFRGGLPARKRPAAAKAPVPADTLPGSAAATSAIPLVTRPSEPGFSVSFTPAQEDALAAEFADEPAPKRYAETPPPAARAPVAQPLPPSEDITSELEGLFDGTDTTIQKRLSAEKTMAARSFGNDADGYAPPDMDIGIDVGGTVDVLLDELVNDDAAAGSETVDQPRPGLDPTDRTPTVDLRTLASSATKDQQQAQTLLEALTLLERDYEEELTASQVLDMSAVREALGNDLDEPTQINESRIREASTRRKGR